MKKIIFSILLVLLFFYGLWVIGVSEGLLQDLIQNSLQETSLSIDLQDFRKGFFFNMNSQRVTLQRGHQPLLSMENVAGKIHALHLFLMRVALSFDGEMGRGRIQGEFDLFTRGRRAHILIDQANIQGIDLFALVGLKGNGLLSGEFKLNGNSGDLKFSINQARFEKGTFAGIVVPLDLFDRARGALSIQGETLRISSFSMEGKGIYGRVKGKVSGNQLDLTLEIMRDSSLRQALPQLSMIETYQVSPGYYMIPIKTVFSF